MKEKASLRVEKAGKDSSRPLALLDFLKWFYFTIITFEAAELDTRGSSP
jgi:hypothetical protein